MPLVLAQNSNKDYEKRQR